MDTEANDNDALHLDLFGDLAPSSWESGDSSDGNCADSEASHSFAEEPGRARFFAAVSAARPVEPSPTTIEGAAGEDSHIQNTPAGPQATQSATYLARTGVRELDEPSCVPCRGYVEADGRIVPCCFHLQLPGFEAPAETDGQCFWCHSDLVREACEDSNNWQQMAQELQQLNSLQPRCFDAALQRIPASWQHFMTWQALGVLPEDRAPATPQPGNLPDDASDDEDTPNMAEEQPLG
eukprot:6240173-Karenia_brevis.AAC.1